MKINSGTSFVPTLDPGLKDECIDEFIRNCTCLLANIERTLSSRGPAMKSNEFRAWYTNMEDVELSVMELSNYIQGTLDRYEYTLTRLDRYEERSRQLVFDYQAKQQYGEYLRD